MKLTSQWDVNIWQDKRGNFQKDPNFVKDWQMNDILEYGHEYLEYKKCVVHNISNVRTHDTFIFILIWVGMVYFLS